MTDYETDIVIIGAGPVGLFMVFEAGMLNMKCHVIDSLSAKGGQCSALYPEKPIYDIPAHPMITGQQLIDSLVTQAAPFKPHYHLSQQVVSVIKTPEGFIVTTSKKSKIKAKVVVIAAGCGAFGPNRPPLANIEKYETKSIFYLVDKRDKFAGKDIVIAGGGDSAVDWAISLSEIAKSVSVVHRRDKFRCAPDSHSKLSELAAAKKINLVVPFQLEALEGEGDQLSRVIVQDLEGNVKALKADYLLPFFGLSMNLGPILDWGLEFDKKLIKVDSATQETNIEGIFAIGDICTYQNKLKLILNGFGECSMAAHAIYKIIHPNTALHFEYSTSKGVVS
jgi:thioredoxin reductase (NADPH)